ncbi:hypothetical protein BV25DRAFT_1822163 [Artomyces pyxidatus]|uniref:Uncharacterized protein n=1 Tax=Artomyces pyxidatus TaxID=48021 RepID=A0ACB8T974_9AGAM|nr:hypothetical protein BV25DRAFT_1822163 [Artomyces pyxidatus]
MAAVLARALRPLPRHASTALASRHALRHIHATAIAHKSKKSAANDGTLFDDSGDLFSDSTPAPVATTSAQPAKPSPAQRTSDRGRHGKLAPDVRAAKFEELLTFVSTRIGLRPAVRDALQVRSSAWTHLFGLATTREQLERVTVHFSKFIESGRKFEDRHVETFVRRCAELKCPDLALAVFSDRPKYRFDLSSPTAGRELLNALHRDRPLSECIELSALYQLYELPPLAADPVACTLLVDACLRAAPKSPHAGTVAHALVPALQDTLAKTPRKPAQKAAGRLTRSWMQALGHVEDALKGKGQKVNWIQEWRTGGQVRVAAV